MIFCKLTAKTQPFPSSSLRAVAQEELNAAEAGKNVGIAILSFISVVTLIFYFFVKNALAVIRVSFRHFYVPGF